MSDKLLQRSAADIVASLPGSEPFAFDAESFQSELKDTLESNFADFLAPGNNRVVDIAGRDVVLIGEMLFSLSKYTHVLACARSTAKAGAVTWASVDAHHASILGARALFCLLGVVVVKANDRYAILDFRPEYGRQDHMRAFQKQHRGVQEPVRILVPQKGKLFEQGDTWTVLNRLLRVVAFARVEDQKAAAELLAVKLGAHKPKRNEILYNPTFWLWRDDINFTKLPIDEIAAFLKGDSDPMFDDFRVTSLIMKLVASIASDLGAQIGLDLKLAVPGLSLAQFPDPILA